MNATKSAGWNELVKQCDHSKIYHLYQWGTLIERVLGHKLFYLQEDNGVFPLAYIKSRIFGDRLLSIPFADYGGPCARDEETANKLVSECLEIAQQLSVDFVEIRSPGSQYFDVMKKHDFERRDDYLTFVFRLDKEIEELWKGIGHKKRNRVMKAEKSGVEIIQAAGRADLKAFHLLYQKTMKRLGSPPQHYKFFDELWNLFYPENLMVLLARHKGEYIAGGLLLLYRDTIHYAYNSSLSDYHSLAPNDLVQWYIIRWGKEHGFGYLDSGRSRENEGTELFKRRWRSESINMPYFYKFCKKSLDQRQELRYRRISQLWSKYVPECVANRVGPWILKQIG